ncbi:nitrate ABC transporter permease [Spirochaetia bacterium]|nr:nitrate ABC transporter permease [Spirochaetia bacterium]
MMIPFLKKLDRFVFLAALLILWQILSASDIVPHYMLPGPSDVGRAFINDFSLLMKNLQITITEACLGLILAVLASFVFAIIMDCSRFLKVSMLPVFSLSQTLPTIAIAPLLILWLGFGIVPKIILVFSTCFFPITMALLGSFADADDDQIKLFNSMGASRSQIYYYYKLPQSSPPFFSALKVSVTYSIISAVVAEWLGGNAGLGVYMIRVRKTYSFDKMFAVIILTALLSLVLLHIVTLIEKRILIYKKQEIL